jgi:hypothetical protein
MRQKFRGPVRGGVMVCAAQAAHPVIRQYTEAEVRNAAAEFADPNSEAFHILAVTIGVENSLNETPGRVAKKSGRDHRKQNVTEWLTADVRYRALCILRPAMVAESYQYREDPNDEVHDSPGCETQPGPRLYPCILFY